jgi:hypothetical protein
MIKLLIPALLLGAATGALAQPSPGTSFDAFAARSQARMTALDTDHDGRISKDEFAARAARRGGSSPEGAKPDGSRMFARLDANSDGYLDTTELNAMTAKRFARMDANHDGMLTAEERQAMRGGTAPEQ